MGEQKPSTAREWAVRALEWVLLLVIVFFVNLVLEAMVSQPLLEGIADGLDRGANSMHFGQISDEYSLRVETEQRPTNPAAALLAPLLSMIWDGFANPSWESAAVMLQFFGAALVLWPVFQRYAVNSIAGVFVIIPIGLIVVASLLSYPVALLWQSARRATTFWKGRSSDSAVSWLARSPGEQRLEMPKRDTVVTFVYRPFELPTNPRSSWRRSPSTDACS